LTRRAQADNSFDQDPLGLIETYDIDRFRELVEGPAVIAA